MLLLILDANEYIFGLGARREHTCEKLLSAITEPSVDISIRICRLIAREVRANLTPEAFKEFIKYIGLFTAIDEDSIVPFEFGSKYEIQGLKPSDALIAAYCEWTGADILVTENRHFLSRQAGLPFKVFTAERYLKLILK